MRLLSTFISVTLLVLASCGDSAPRVELPEPPDVARDAAAAWQQLADNPGTPGIDYSPSRILVVYRKDAQLPASWPAASLPPAATAAAQSNPMLRADKQYEALTDAIAARYGLTIARQVYLGDSHFASFEVPDSLNSAIVLQRIRAEASDFVAHAIYSPLRRANYMPNDPDFSSGPTGQQWSHWKVNCPGAWDITLGSNSVIIAVVDTGVRLTHEELSATVINPLLQFPSAVCDIANNDKTIEDNDGHGTFIAGVAVAQANNARTIIGVAPNCKVLPIKISEDTGFAWVDDLIAGGYLADQLGASVINYSWGGSSYVPLEEAMVNAVTANGTLFVCAAGNDNTPVDEYPSSFANALSTGATNSSDNRASFSNYGASVDIAAPGDDLKSCAFNSDNAYDPNGSGTSYAAPMVAAGAALLWSYRPELTLAQVRTALVSTGPPVPGFLTAIRRLDLAAALNSVIVPVYPSIAGVSQQPYQNLGIVANKGTWNLSLQSPVNIARATYTLDLAPVGTDGPEDIVVETTAGGTSPAQFDLTASNNQAAALRVDYFSTTNHTGSLTIAPLWIFNQRGDFDGDGLVTGSDLLALQPLIGLRSSDAGYMGFADNDADGRITEADAAAVGYYYGGGATLPAISAVTPTSGITGAPTSFSATVAGTGQLDYAWNFGGGAAPNASTDPAPTVTLGATGDYSASLTVTSAFGSDTFPFTLSVTTRPDPTAALSATPKIGLAPLDVTFDASGSSAPGGSIVQYDWSWDGDTLFEDTTSSPSNAHTFAALGDYTVRLRVTDDLSRTAETTVEVRVITGITISNYGETVLGLWGNSTSTDNLRWSATNVGGKPAVIWIWRGATWSDPNEVYVAVAKTATPTALSDWRIDKVYTGEVEASIGATAGICEVDGEAAFLYDDAAGMQFGRYHGNSWSIHTVPGPASHATVGTVAGKPAVLGLNTGKMHYAYAKVADPQSAADWVSYEITAPDNYVGQPYSYAFQLRDIGGRAMFHGMGPNSGDRRIVFATANPPGAGDWASYTWDGEHTGQEIYGWMYNDGGLPALAFYYETDTESFRRYWKADSLTPTQSSNWTSHNLPTGVSYYREFGSIPYVSGSSSRYIALSGSPADTADWLSITLPNGYAGIPVDHGGLPGMVGRTSGQVVYRHPIP